MFKRIANGHYLTEYKGVYIALERYNEIWVAEETLNRHKRICKGRTMFGTLMIAREIIRENK